MMMDEGMKFNVWIKPLTLSRFMIDVEADTKVSEVKKMIAEHLQATSIKFPSQFDLVHKGSILKDSMTLQDTYVSK